MEEARTPFDLSKGPLLRATILKLGTSEHVLLLTMHHIVSDAWSSGIFFRELGELYTAFLEGKPSPCRNCRFIRGLRRVAKKFSSGEGP